MNKEDILTTRDLTIGYRQNGRPDLIIGEKLSFTLRRGELVCLLGPNGAGKSTLMRTIAQMQKALGGEIWLGGNALGDLTPKALARHLSIVLTERVDAGHLSAYDLIALGRHPYTDWRGRLKADDDAVIRWAISAVGAEALADRFVSELSDGERQKIMIARALAQQPDLILLDEPTAFLDLPHRVDIMLTLRNLARDTQRAIFLSTHDLDLALRSADRIFLLPGGDGVITGAPEDLVLSGALQATFARDTIAFDPVSGSFRFQQKEGLRIGVIGSGIESLWTARALERGGFDVAYNEATEPLHVIVEKQENGYRWTSVERGNPRPAVTTLYELLNKLYHSQRYSH